MYKKERKDKRDEDTKNIGERRNKKEVKRKDGREPARVY